MSNTWIQKASLRNALRRRPTLFVKNQMDQLPPRHLGLRSWSESLKACLNQKSLGVINEIYVNNMSTTLTFGLWHACLQGESCSTLRKKCLKPLDAKSHPKRRPHMNPEKKGETLSVNNLFESLLPGCVF